MPRVKFDYVVSFSSEDPEHPARNLLAEAAGAGRWLCARSQPSCSVLLQLARAVQISSVQVCAHRAALVEVLVGRSESPEQPLQVLVPRSVFLSPAESRAAAAGGTRERVRSFSGEQLAAAAAHSRWDRVRVVCSQPYDKHCQYGLSFIHIYEPEGAPSAPAPLSAPLPAPAPASVPALAPAPFDALLSSDEDEFRPGELFAAARAQSSARQDSAPAAANLRTSTDAQIRQATTRALRSTEDAAPRLVASLARAGGGGSDTPIARAGGNGGADRTLARASGSGGAGTPLARDGGGGDAGAPLAGVVFALSGYQNPRRAAVRAAALACGARYEPAWSPRCTHLVCAFPNTPKLQEVRAAPGGAAAAVVTAEWVEQCRARRRLLPWRWFATEPGRRESPPAGALEDTPPRAPSADCDTDEEIERVRARKRRRDSRRSPAARADGSDSDDSTATLPGATARRGARGTGAGALPALFEGCTFALAAGAHAALDARLVRRYVLAYGGLVLEASELDEHSAVDYVLWCGDEAGWAGAGARAVRADWVWRCHAARRRCSVAGYELAPAPARTVRD